MLGAAALAREPHRIDGVEERLDDLVAQHAALRRWLAENAPAMVEEQRHLEEGSAERAYWHYGYMMALQDVLRLLETRRGLDS
jgi:hypothetical protein